jgi:hypothetical protein
MPYRELHDFFSLGAPRGFGPFSRRQCVGGLLGLIVGGYLGLQLELLPLVRIALFVGTPIIGIVLCSLCYGVVLWRQLWYLLRYALRRLLHAEQDGAVLHDESPPPPAFYCEEVSGGTILWSYWQPGTVEEG